MSENFDLFGNPVRPGRGQKGRPPFEATDRDRNKVKLLLALGWSIERIANAIDVSPATLKRHFRAELKLRDAMRDRLVARQFEIAMEKASTGSVAALKELDRLIIRNDMMVPGAAPASSKEKAAKLGKKEAALRAAREPDPQSSLGELMARRHGLMN